MREIPPDIDCYTLPNGDCIAPHCRLHGGALLSFHPGPNCGHSVCHPHPQCEALRREAEIDTPCDEWWHGWFDPGNWQVCPAVADEAEDSEEDDEYDEWEDWAEDDEEEEDED